MQVRLISDLHTEMAPFEIKPSGEDVLIIAGDVSPDFSACLQMLTDYRDLAPDIDIIYILGNHCSYDKSIDETIQLWRNVNMAHFHFLENESVVINGIRFFGSTMWTDLKTDDVYRVQSGITDFYRIIGLTPDSWRVRHYHSKKSLSEVLASSVEPVVVITHHLPIQACIDPKYKGLDAMNSAFASTDMEELVANQKVIHWLHGHTHSSVDITHNGTPILCNPRGRVTMWKDKEIKKENKQFDPNLIFTIELNSLDS